MGEGNDSDASRDGKEHREGGNPTDRIEDVFVEMDVVEGDGTPVNESGEEGEAIVPKRRFCERCELFSDPPEVSCTNPDTEIRQLVDDDHFLVYNCPVVEGRQGTGSRNRSSRSGRTE